MEQNRLSIRTIGVGFGLLAVVWGMVVSLYVLFGPIITYGGTSGSGTISGIDYILGDGYATPALFFTPLAIIVFSCFVGYLVWSEKTTVLWIISIGLALVSIVSILTIGWVVAIATVLLLLSAFFLTIDTRFGNVATSS